MPFKSRDQEIWMRINKPELYKKWVAKYGHFKKSKRKKKKGVRRKSRRKTKR